MNFLCAADHTNTFYRVWLTQSVWILVLSEYNLIYSQRPYKRKAAVNCMVAQQEESWQHYKLLVQHFKSAVKQNAEKKYNIVERILHESEKGTFLVCFPFLWLSASKNADQCRHFWYSSNFEYFCLSSEVFPFSIILNKKKEKDIGTSTYTWPFPAVKTA